MSHPVAVFTFTLHLMLGCVGILSVIIGYAWFSSRDKTLGVYLIYLITCLAAGLVKLIGIDAAPPGMSIMENTWWDEVIGSLAGGAYIFFFGWVFQFSNRKRTYYKRLWYTALGVMGFQFIYLLYTGIFLTGQYFHPVISPLILTCITLASVLMLVAAGIQKNKTPFQKIILAGAIVFFLLITTISIQELLYKNSSFRGFNIFYIALLVENVFFVSAASKHIKDIYEKAAQEKVVSYQLQIETEQVVNYFTKSISEQSTVDDLLWDVSKNLIGKLGFEDCMIYLWNEDKTVLLQKAGYGAKGAMQYETDKTKYHVPRGKGIVGAAAEDKQSILVNDTSKDARYFTADGAIRLSELCVPMLHNNETLGVINTEHAAKGFYTQRHLQILNAIASHCADKIKKINAEEKIREKEIEVLKLNKDLVTSQLTTLRAQMNPHFIFNALNSIQQYVLQGNVMEANKYLSKFSKLQREVLNHSDQDFISLEKEIEVLSLYLELEQLRFDGNFTYEIKTDTAIDDDEIKIPPMIVQPFVENSIWHGLMPKQGERWVHILFELNSDDLLVCTITDNGIGRDASARLKQNGHTQHKSKGLSLVYDRLNILRQQYGQAFEVNIKDLVDVNHVPVGTEVKLHIYTG